MDLEEWKFEDRVEEFVRCIEKTARDLNLKLYHGDHTYFTNATYWSGLKVFDSAKYGNCADIISSERIDFSDEKDLDGPMVF